MNILSDRLDLKTLPSRSSFGMKREGLYLPLFSPFSFKEKGVGDEFFYLTI